MEYFLLPGMDMMFLVVLTGDDGMGVGSGLQGVGTVLDSLDVRLDE